RKSNACAADLLLRWGADETAVNDQGQTPSASIPALENVPEDDRPKIERLTRLLAFAPQDKAWRRRGFLVLCRTHQERLRLAVKIPHTADSGGFDGVAAWLVAPMNEDIFRKIVGYL
ncbi:unnamed protein product, partial [Hapterophycus canaliculatus]